LHNVCAHSSKKKKKKKNIKDRLICIVFVGLIGTFVNRSAFPLRYHFFAVFFDQHTCGTVQWFSNLSCGPPTTAYFVCLPHLSHLIQLISSLVESARLELGVAYERHIQNRWWLGVHRTGLRTTGIADH